MEAWKIKLFIRVCLLCVAGDCLQLKEEELICLIQECLAVALFLEDVGAQQTSYFLLGPLYEKIYQMGKAIEYYKNHLQIANQLGDMKAEYSANQKLGNAYFFQGNFLEATKYHEKCVKFAKEIGHGKGIEAAYAHSNLGGCYQKLGKYHKAIECYKKSLRIAREIGDRELEGGIYGMLGTTYESLGKYHEAIEYNEKLLFIANEISYRVGQAHAYGSLGNIYQSLGYHQKAIEYQKTSLGIALSIGDRRREGAAYLRLGNAYRSLGNYQKAQEYLEKSLSIAMEVEDKEGEGAAYGNLGNTYQSLGKYPEAIEYHKKSLRIAVEIGDRNGEGDDYGNLGNTYQSLGKYPEAIEYHEKSLRIAIGIGDKKGEGVAHGGLGTTYSVLGKYPEAIKHQEKHLRIAKELGDKQGEGYAYENLGDVSQLLGKYQEAMKYYETSLSIAIEIGDRELEGGAYGKKGTVYSSLGQDQEAIKYHKKKLNIAMEIGNKRREKSCYDNLGTLYRGLDKYNEAIEYNQNCLNIAVEIGDRRGEGDAYGNIGSTYHFLGKHQEALEYEEKSLMIAKEIGDKRGEAHRYVCLGTVYMILGNYHEAVEHHEKGLSIAIEIREREIEGKCYAGLGEVYCHLAIKCQILNNTDQKRANLKEAEKYLNKCIQSYELLLDELEQDGKISIVDKFIVFIRTLEVVYVDTQQTKEALLISDRGRARALGDLLTVKYSRKKESTSRSGSIGVTNIEKILSTQSNFGILFYALHPGFACIWVLAHQSPLHFHFSPMKGFESSILHTSLWESNSRRIAEKSMVKLVEKAYDKMNVRKGVKCEDRSLGLPEAEDHVIEEEPVLSQVAEQNATEGRESGKEINDTGARCIEDYEDDEKPLEFLYDALVAPVQHKLVQDEIVIIPNGALYMVPFAALQDPNTGQFLSETKRIRLAPSLTTLKVLQECSDDQHYKSGALIVGNPEIGKVKFEGSERLFDNLPGAEKEAKEIAEILKVEPLIGRLATKEAVIQKLRVGVSVIHFAAHGSVNGQIILAPSASLAKNSIPDEKDFVLTMREAQESGIQAKLVVLSCCHSGRGEIKSEGVVGLSRAFLAAGARAVVASLWAIYDDATKVFMLKFYSHLKNGESASKSLQQAMKDMRETERYSEPKYWAAFFLIGDDVTISPSTHIRIQKVNRRPYSPDTYGREANPQRKKLRI